MAKYMTPSWWPDPRTPLVPPGAGPRPSGQDLDRQVAEEFTVSQSHLRDIVTGLVHPTLQDPSAWAALGGGSCTDRAGDLGDREARRRLNLRTRGMTPSPRPSGTSSAWSSWTTVARTPRCPTPWSPGHSIRVDLVAGEAGDGRQAQQVAGGRTRTPGPEQRPTRWLTPSPIVQALGSLTWTRAGAGGHELAARTYLEERDEDGLVLPWEGRVWLNPVRCRGLPFLERMADHGNGVALIFARTETKGVPAVEYGTAPTPSSSLRAVWCSGDADKGTPPRPTLGAEVVWWLYGHGNVDALHRSGLAAVT